MNHSNNSHLAYPKHRADLDGLRAISILCVLGFHTFPTQVPSGFIGVDIFFVISGFLISYIILESLKTNRFSFQEFYARRIKRIFPALIIVLLTCLIIGWYVLFAEEYQQFGKHLQGSSLFISNFIFLSETGYFDNYQKSKPLLHLWSLGVEWQFYLIWPLLLFVAIKRRFNILHIILGVILISFAMNFFGVEQNRYIAFYSPLTRFWELACGAFTAYFILEKSNFSKNFFLKKIAAINQIKKANIMASAGLILLVLSLYKINSENFPGPLAILPITAVMLLILSPQSWINRKILAHPLLTWWGLISFSLYLWHWPLLSFAYIIEGENFLNDNALYLLLIAVFLASLTYKFIEEPIHKYNRLPHATKILLSLMLILAACGFIIEKQEGFNFRKAESFAFGNSFLPNYRQSCKKMLNEFYFDDWCNKGSSDERLPNTVLFGDSFSNAYSTMLTTYAKDNGDFSFIQLARGQCPSLKNYGPPFCKATADKIISYVKENKNIKTVILAMDWATYLNGKNFELNFYRETAEAFRTSLNNTLQELALNDKKIIIFLSPPHIPNPKLCLKRRIQFSQNHICGADLVTVENLESHYRNYLLPLLEARNISYFDPFDYFCDDKKCSVFNGEKIYSIDGGHLSIYGGEFLATAAKTRLDELLRQ